MICECGHRLDLHIPHCIQCKCDGRVSLEWVKSNFQVDGEFISASEYRHAIDEYDRLESDIYNLESEKDDLETQVCDLSDELDDVRRELEILRNEKLETTSIERDRE